MIYKKAASFPYPVLSNTSSNYTESEFNFDVVNLNEGIEFYNFEISFDLTSDFVKQLLSSGKASLVLIIQSQDNYVVEIKEGDKYVSVPKNRLKEEKLCKYLRNYPFSKLS